MHKAAGCEGDLRLERTATKTWEKLYDETLGMRFSGAGRS